MIDLRLGDCLEVLKTLDSNSVDAVVTDPPAGIGFMGKTWDSSIGFREMLSSSLRECLRVAKPGSILLCWALPRTSHWAGMAIEDAGWQIEDRITHVFGTGFPKHKSKLKPAAEDWRLARKPGQKWLGVDACRVPHKTINGGNLADNPHLRSHINGGNGGKIIATEKNRRVVVPDQDGRWPANFALSHHDDCEQVGEKTLRGDRRGDPGGKRGSGFYSTGSDSGDSKPNARVYGDETIDVWNCHPECPVRLLDEQSGDRPGCKSPSLAKCESKYRPGQGAYQGQGPIYGDSGGASRFYYCSKSSKSDRAEFNTHPTVKSTNLMRWLCRLACPSNGLILDPFMGSGSTGKAAVLEGFSFIGIEQDATYYQIADRRISEVKSDIPLFA